MQTNQHALARCIQTQEVTFLRRILVIMVALDSVDALSDDDVTLPKPPSVTHGSPESAAKPKPKVKGKASSKKAAQPTAIVKKDVKPKAEAKKKTMKRPAASLASTGSLEPAMKRPAGAKRDPNHISTCKSLYKSTGIWSIKLFQKEVIRVSRLNCQFIPVSTKVLQTVS